MIRENLKFKGENTQGLRTDVELFLNGYDNRNLEMIDRLDRINEIQNKNRQIMEYKHDILMMLNYAERFERLSTLNAVEMQVSNFTDGCYLIMRGKKNYKFELEELILYFDEEIEKAIIKILNENKCFRFGYFERGYDTEYYFYDVARKEVVTYTKFELITNLKSRCLAYFLFIIQKYI